MMELLWKCLMWYYEYTMESEYALWYGYYEYVRDTQGSEYTLVCSWIMFEFVWICLKHNLKYLCKPSSTYRYLGVFRILSKI